MASANPDYYTLKFQSVYARVLAQRVLQERALGFRDCEIHVRPNDINLIIATLLNDDISTITISRRPS